MPAMQTATMQQLDNCYRQYGEMVYRICYLHLRDPQEASDAVQNTFLRLLQHLPQLTEPEHQKAWLIVTARNLCRDQLRHWWRRTEPLGEHLPAEPQPEHDALRQALLVLPSRYKLPIYLFYYEGYTTAEIAALLGKKDATVRSLLHRGRELLRGELERSDTR